jgi:CHAT domain-containing protein
VEREAPIIKIGPLEERLVVAVVEVVMVHRAADAVGKDEPVVPPLAAKARLDQDGSPRIVVLNACETGRQAPVLTDWGGWPRTFWDGGAAVFIGTSWAVDQSAAAAFTEGFYDALLQGQTLANASVTAREEARKAKGDSSWLAYVVYGNPVARLPHED